MNTNLNLTYANYCYLILVAAVKGMDSIYENYIVDLVGNQGLNALKDSGYLETCGTISGRQLYVLTGPGVSYIDRATGGVH